MLYVRYALLHCCVLFAVWSFGVGFIGMRHSPVWLSRGPSRMFLLLYLTTTFVWSNSAVHPASQSVPMDIRELCVSPGIVWASRAALGSSFMLRRHVSWLDWKMVPFGNPTLIWVRRIPVLV
jgi:hypothetical protein